MRADSQVYTLGAALNAPGQAVTIRGGEYMFIANGSGGPTVALQIQQPDSTWSTVAALGGYNVVSTTTLPYAASPVALPACVVRVSVSGGTSPSVNAWLAGIG
ncbi:hypothetical protein BLA39750_02228 [Burkholderia lata]|uniref:Uncharacterized protein n=1 Tax=Burkholderia lata (strain ATCC 17760 / DSM 23089 / LMG 22485 / NCIMB 9086 / R18194 / 383) TaxID=482957 RepID=A0A6P2WL86_BURL3|nr:hypothetical protein [Burkholderia lata]VWC95993.1 hypothetical protein BLA39750_02228 [Burkholderia lata]